MWLGCTARPVVPSSSTYGSLGKSCRAQGQRRMGPWCLRTRVCSPAAPLAGWERVGSPGAAARTFSVLTNPRCFSRKVAEPVCWKSRGNCCGAAPSGFFCVCSKQARRSLVAFLYPELRSCCSRAAMFVSKRRRFRFHRPHLRELEQALELGLFVTLLSVLSAPLQPAASVRSWGAWGCAGGCTSPRDPVRAAQTSRL